MFLQLASDYQGSAAPALTTARTADPLPDATAPLAFLERWSEPDKAVFFRFVAEQEALHKDLTLYQLNAKIARQSGLMWHNTPDKCRMTDDGKLSVAAMLHATLLALRQCIPVAMLKEQAEHETRLVRMQVRRNAQALVTCADAFVTLTRSKSTLNFLHLVCKTRPHPRTQRRGRRRTTPVQHRRSRKVAPQQ